MLDELSIIDTFLPLAGEGAFCLRDDAAALSPPAGSNLVVTTDMIAEGVHFLAGDPPETIAKKALRVNLSDLAAKGAKPLAYVLNLSLGTAIDEGWLAGFAHGLHLDQVEFQLALLGGDTISASATIISITAFGTVAAGRWCTASAAHPEISSYVSGIIGAAGAGLALLRGESGPWSWPSHGEREALIGRYRIPQPRTALAPALLAHASAAMDVSDGLVGDCDKLAAASRPARPISTFGGMTIAGRPALRPRRWRAGSPSHRRRRLRDPRRRSAWKRSGIRSRCCLGGRAGGADRALAPGEGPTRIALHGKPLSLTRRSYIHGRT